MFLVLVKMVIHVPPILVATVNALLLAILQIAMMNVQSTLIVHLLRTASITNASMTDASYPQIPALNQKINVLELNVTQLLDNANHIN